MNPAMVAVIEEMGGSYLSTDAQSSPAKQLSDVESLIARGVDVLILLAQDADAIGPAVEAAVKRGDPGVGYDRLIENPNTYYLTFDNREVGRMQARAVYEVQPTGNYVFIKGSSADPKRRLPCTPASSTCCRSISTRARSPWSASSIPTAGCPANAQRNMEQILTANDNQVDAVVASNDGTAGGVIAALAAQGMDGEVPGLRPRTATWAALEPRRAGHPDRQRLEATPGNWARPRRGIAFELAEGTAMGDIEGSQSWTKPVGDRHDRHLPGADPDHPRQSGRRGRRRLESPWRKLCQGVESGTVEICD